MDTTKKYNLDFIYSEFDSLSDKIKNQEVTTDPFPYIMIENGVSDFFTCESILENIPILAEKNNTPGRVEYLFDIDFNHNCFKKLEKTIIEKFNLEVKDDTGWINDETYLGKNFSVNLWRDTYELDITEIHLDYLIRDLGSEFEQKETTEKNQLVFSMHIYLPDDNTQENLGTSIYKINNNFANEVDKNMFYLPADYPLKINTMITSDKDIVEKYCTKVKTIPFKKGLVYIHPTTPNSWHSAPRIPKNYTRQSLMFRWSWSEFKKV